jgi:hypothetical protein
MAVEKLDMEALKSKNTLTEDDAEAIRLSSLEEEKPADEEHADDKPGEGEPADKEHQPEGKTEDEKKAEAEATAAENKRILEAREEDLSEAEQETRTTLLKAAEDEKAAKEKADSEAKAARETEITEYATKNEMQVQDARDDFEHRDKILDKYKGDAKQLALANYHLQRLNDQTQEEIKVLRAVVPSQEAELTYDAVLKLIDDNKIAIDGKSINRDKAIAAYRETDADTVELSDEQVLKLAVKELKTRILSVRKDNLRQMLSKAKDKRATLLSSIPEADQKWLEDIKPVLEHVGDAQVMQDDFSLEPYILYAKGKHYDEDRKAYGEKEYQRGLEQAKILTKGKNPAAAGNGAPKGKKSVSLTDAQKTRAVEMYGNLEGVTDEKCYEMFIDSEGLLDEPKK